MGEFSLTHILLFSVIALVFLGPKRLPQLGQSLGQAIKNFKEGLNDVNESVSQSKPTQLQKQNRNPEAPKPLNGPYDNKV